MKMCMFMSKMQALTVNLPIPGGVIDHRINVLTPQHQKEKVIVVMGATGAGKSKLSIDLAHQFPAEIINSDKMQVYKGLDIVTNKITKEEQEGIPHHLLGITNFNLDFSANKFCDLATLTVDSIITRGRLPIIVGGSNSYIEVLVDHHSLFRSKYECCFLWVDVSMPLLHTFLSERIDKMVANGMLEELRELFDPNDSDYSRGIRKSIGVPEFHEYFQYEAFVDEESREKMLQQAIREMKENTCKLACRQVGKICRLRDVKGWNIHRLDATQALREYHEKEALWKRLVRNPSSKIVCQFLHDIVPQFQPLRMPVFRTAFAAGTH